MAKKRILTWRKADKRWMKIVEGRAYYFGSAKSIDDTKAYHEAEQRYLEFVANRQRHAPITVAVSKATVAQIAELYVQHLEARLNRHDLSLSYFIRARTSMRELASALGSTRRFEEIGELDLERYKHRMLMLPPDPRTGVPISIVTAKGRLDSVKALYRWAYITRLVDEQPRNLLDYTKFELPAPDVKVFTVDEVRRLWAAAPDRTKAFISLGLNCGFGQGDIAALRVKEVDLGHGFIEHPRVKTGVAGHHRLWPITAELLARHRDSGAAAGDDRWFISDRGRPLVHEALADGKLKRTDAVKNAFWRIQYHTGINGSRGFYSLRKTSASLIEQIDPLVTSMFLTHSVREMKRHYALRNWTALDAAIIELGRKFDLALPA